VLVSLYYTFFGFSGSCSVMLRTRRAPLLLRCGCRERCSAHNGRCRDVRGRISSFAKDARAVESAGGRLCWSRAILAKCKRIGVHAYDGNKARKKRTGNDDDDERTLDRELHSDAGRYPAKKRRRRRW